jgi:uncharacterized protein with NRDE domain
MCIAALAWMAHPRWKLVALANRDEFHARPAAPLDRWADQPGLIAGRDLQSGGTWLGVREGDAARFVLVTNHRADGYPLPDRPSRGALVTELLDGANPRAVPSAEYNPFNLFSASPDALWLLTNHPEQRIELGPGLHGLSNGPFLPPWPKTRELAAALARWLETDATATEPLLAALADETMPPAIPGESGPESPFSPVFIRNPAYGTRCSTLVLIDRQGDGTIIERRFDATGTTTGETQFTFRWGG